MTLSEFEWATFAGCLGRNAAPETSWVGFVIAGDPLGTIYGINMSAAGAVIMVGGNPAIVVLWGTYTWFGILEVVTFD